MSNNKKKPALGRGLSALLEKAETDITTKNFTSESVKTVVGNIALLEIQQIETNPFQPRTHFEEEALQELSDSIKTQGIIQPITVRKMGNDKFQLISGERRFRASQMAGLTEIPAYIRIANDQAMLEMALVENIQRENLDAIEVAISYKRLIDECKLTQEQLSDKVSKQRSTVTNYLRLLKLPAEIQVGIRDKKISMGHARTLINVEDKETQLAIFEAIMEQDLSVRQAEEMVRNFGKDTADGEDEHKVDIKKPKAKNPLGSEYKKINASLADHFATKVELSVQPNGKGKIAIPFASTEELERILKLMNL